MLISGMIRFICRDTPCKNGEKRIIERKRAMDEPISATGQFPAKYWHILDDGRIQCDLCPRDCRLHDGQRGACFVRGRVGDEMVLTTYGRSSGFCVDPIEKKPLTPGLSCRTHRNISVFGQTLLSSVKSQNEPAAKNWWWMRMSKNWQTGSLANENPSAAADPYLTGS